MSKRKLFFVLFIFVAFLFATGITPKSLYSKKPPKPPKPPKQQILMAGQNVNMVSGTTLPGGDPYLQRQNEPSIAVSTRNPLHLLAGANDYRTVDMPISGEQLPGFSGPIAAGDAWLGVFKSFNGGQSWSSTLLPGFPQECPPNSTSSSPLCGFQAAADPVVRAGTNGLFYYSGIAFNRTKTPGQVNSVVFVARFIDNNNDESEDPIKYIDTKIIADDKKKDKKFVDKPWIAVDVPHGKGKGKTVTIDGQDIPRSNVYIVYSVFTGSGDKLKSEIIFRRSTNCGTKWEKPIVLSKGHDLNQGATIAVDPRGNGQVYVAWRRFYKGKKKKQSNAIIIARSTNGGKKFHKVTNVAEIPPFDQPSTSDESIYHDPLDPIPGTSFRTNSYPTLAVDDKGIVYLAWAQRGEGLSQEARIVLTTSREGKHWSLPISIEEPTYILGHQFMPSMAFAAGKLTVVWYDQRNDFCADHYGFGYWINDWLPYRHTIDVWVAQADTQDYPNLNWMSTQVSRYLYNVDEYPEGSGNYRYYQVQFNPPNYSLFGGGTLPFHGDYVDIAPSPMFVLDDNGQWRFNTEPTDTPVFYVTWTDNRDVRPPSPPDYDWTDYTPPDSEQSEEYISPGREDCGYGENRPGMRNQNIYTSRITQGVEVGSPANSKPLDLDVPRSFVVFVKNTTEEIKSFRLTIANQPTGGQASFLQFELLDWIDVTIAPYSTISRPVFVESSDPNASVRINIDEIDEPGGEILPDGLKSFILLNADPTNPEPVGDDTEETHEPVIETPNIVNWYVNPNIVNPNIVNPNIVNPNIVNPNIVNPNIVNPNIVNPNIVNPNIVNPNIVNPNIVNPNIVNPNIVNPNIVNPNIVNISPEEGSITDVEWTVRNEGNTASSYTFKTIAKEAVPEGIYLQLLIYRVHYTPGVAGSELSSERSDINPCELKMVPQHELLSNIVNPNIVNPNIVNPNIVNPNIVNAGIENATFSVAPGDEVHVTLRVIDTGGVTAQGLTTTQAAREAQAFALQDFIESVGGTTTAQEVDSEDAEQEIEEPKAASSILLISSESLLPEGLTGENYSVTLKAVGGTEPYTWWVNPDDLPPGLRLYSDGVISGTPTLQGTYSFTAQVTDSSFPDIQSDNQRFWVTIKEPEAPPLPLTITNESPLPPGIIGSQYGVTLIATGEVAPYRWSLVNGLLPDGLSLDILGVISGTPTLEGTFTFTLQVIDSDSTPNTTTKELSITIVAPTDVYTIRGTVLTNDGTPLYGVRLQGLPHAPKTNEFGFYSDTVPWGWSGTATPFIPGYSIDPPSQSYSNVTSPIITDYTAYLLSYTISGTVTVDGSPLAGVVMNGLPGNPITNASGHYTAAVEHNWFGTVIPTLAGYVLDPASRSYDPVTSSQENQDYDASLLTYSISGRVTVDSLPLQGVVMDALPGLPVTDPDGYYTVIVPYGWSALVTPILDGFTFDPATRYHDPVTYNQMNQDYAATYVEEYDDTFEPNDDRTSATLITAGTYSNLRLLNDDWYKVDVAGGKDLKVTMNGTLPEDIDLEIYDSSGNHMVGGISASENETVYASNLTAGLYFIFVQHFGTGLQNSYSITVEIGEDFGEGQITGTVGIMNVRVEIRNLYNIHLWHTFTDGSGDYRISLPPENYKIHFDTRPISNYYSGVNYIREWYDNSPGFAGAKAVSVEAGLTTSNINAQLAEGGAIEGTVTGPGGGENVLEGILVDVWGHNRTLISYAYTDEQGNYTVEGIPTGNFKVRFRPDEGTYATEWYTDKYSYDEADTVPVQAGGITSGIDAQLTEGGEITGTVTDISQSGIQGVRVDVYDSSQQILISRAWTDQYGDYTVPRIPTGNFKIYFNANFTDTNHVSEWYDNKLSFDEATAVSVQAGEQTPGIHAQLEVGGYITGKVTEPTGNGLYRIRVDVFDLNGNPVVRSYTDENGDYTVKHVSSGILKVRFRPDVGNYGVEWYDDWSSYNEATFVWVQAGQTTSGIDAQLEVGGSITGRVTSSTGGGIKNIRVAVYDSSYQFRISDSFTDVDGYFTVPRMPTSIAKIYFDADYFSTNYVSEWFADMNSFEEAYLVPTTAGQETPYIDAVLAAKPGLSITTTSVSSGFLNMPYSATLEAAGGTEFYHWSLIGGTLPEGLTLNSKGVVSGTPINAGTSNFTVQVTDSSSPQQTADQGLSITISISGQGPTISGKVTVGGSDLEGVLMAGLPGDPTTNSSGFYSAIVPPGWSGTVTPTLTPYTFDPPSRIYENVTSDLTTGQVYTATLWTYAISGTVTADGSPVQGVLMAGLPGDPTTDTSGFYTATVDHGWSGTVTPTTLAEFTFDPASRNYDNVTSNWMNQNFTAFYVGGDVDDQFEENDDFESARVIPIGTTPNLKLLDDDWYKVNVAGGNDLKVSVNGTLSYDIDVAIYDSSRNHLAEAITQYQYETVYVSNLTAGDYYIHVGYFWDTTLPYSMTVEIGDFGLGEIGGRVTDTTGEIGLNVDVWIYDIHGQHLWHTISDQYGDYIISLPPEDYIIRFITFPSGSGVNYLGEWYNDRFSFWEADAVTVPAGPTTYVLDAQLETAGAISGRVTDTEGNALQGIYVSVYNSNPTRVSNAWTDEDGQYTVERIPTGNYKVRFRPWGDYATEWNEDKDSFEEADPVAVEAGLTTSGIDAQLAEGGTISGTVTDNYGAGIENVLVYAYDSSGIVIRSLYTDANGNYSISQLPAGNVKIFFRSDSFYGLSTSGNYVSEWYSDKISLEEADAVSVQAGQTISGIDAQLEEGGYISGRVTDSSGTGIYDVRVWPFDLDGHAIQYGYTFTDENGYYTLDRVPVGYTKVRFRPEVGDYAVEWYNDTTSYAEAVAVSVVANQTTSGIDAQFADIGGYITGIVKDSAGFGIESVRVWAYDSSYQLMISHSFTDTDGNYTIPRMPTCNAKIYFDADYNRLNYVSEFYPDKSSFEEADSVSTVVGQETPGINAELEDKPGLGITTASLPDGMVASPYSTTLEASGGTEFYYWSLVSGALPNGLVLHSTGLIDGIPTTLGTFIFTVQITDHSSPLKLDSQQFSIDINSYVGPDIIISGTVKFNDQPLSGVVMAGLPGDPTTSALGEYVVTVPSGWSGTVIPTLAGYAFVPASRSYDDVTSHQMNQEYTASVGYTISGTVTSDGSPLPGMVMNGFPLLTITDEHGEYAAAVPSGWTGTVTPPTLTGYIFDPTSRSYTNVNSNMPNQDYAASFVGGELDDTYEENDDFESAQKITPGTYTNLVYLDEDWYKVFIWPDDEGKDLKVHMKGTIYPDPNVRRDLDFAVLNSSGRMLGYVLSGCDDETLYIPDLAAGWYYIGINYFSMDGAAYSMTVEVGDSSSFGIGYISGRITDGQGHGLENINVELYDIPFDWDISRPLITTDSNGNYKIGHGPGNYKVRFNLSSFPDFDWAPDPNYLGEYYDDKSYLDEAATVSIVAGTTSDGINAELVKGGTITGRVTDPTGDGVEFVYVRVRDLNGNTISGVWTDENGQYEAERIPTGYFKVNIIPTTENYGREWYDDKPSFDDADPVWVQAGQTTSGIDAQLEEEGYVAGRVTDSYGNGIEGVRVWAYDTTQIRRIPVQTSWTDENGNYFIRRIPTSHVKIYFEAPGGTYYVSEWYDDKTSFEESDPIWVQTTQTTSNIDAQLADGGKIAGRVTDLAGNGLYSTRVTVFDLNGNGIASVLTNANGDYTVEHLLPGNYKVRFRPETGNWAVEWYNDKNSYADADTVSVEANQTTYDINAQLAENGGFIEGQVKDINLDGIEGVRVIVCDSSYQRAISWSFTDASGYYSVPRIPTSNVKVFFNADFNRLGYASEFYDDKSSFEEATLVPAHASETTSGIDAVLGDRPSLTITTTSLPFGVVASPYSATLEAAGGTEYYHWSLAPGSDPLPNGLVLHDTGLIDGIPATQSTFNFTVQVIDSSSPLQIATQGLSITINPYVGPDFIISGTVTYGGAPFNGVIINGLLGNPTTNALGEYIALVPPDWSGLVTPTLAEFAFDPESRNYVNVTTNWMNQNYTAFYVGSDQDDSYEENDDFGSAAVIPIGTTTDLNLLDDDWYKIYVSAGKDLKVTVNGAYNYDIDVAIYDSSGNHLAEAITQYQYETVYVSNLPAGLYYIHVGYFWDITLPYSMTVEIGDFELGEIEGRVTDSAGTTGINVDVWIYDLHGQHLWHTFTDQNGDYRISLPPEDYIIRFYTFPSGNLYSGVNYLGEWYNNKSSFREADAVTVPAGPTTYVSDAQLDEAGAISGRVTDSDGNGLEWIYVSVYNSDTRRVSDAWTDEDGQYTVERIPTGNHKVRFRPWGNYATEWNKDKNSFAEADLVPVQTGSTTSGIDAQLEEGGTISGRVTNSGGDGIENVRVFAYDVSGISIRSRDTDANGYYSISQLPIGNVKIFFRSDSFYGVSTSGNYVSEWYSDKISLEEADAVSVQAGQTISGVDAQLEEGGYISGRVTDSSGTGIYHIRVWAFDLEGHGIQYGYTFTDENGYYVLDRVPTGHVKVRFRPEVGDFAVEWYDDKTSYAEADAISIVATQTTSGIDAQLADIGGYITGRVTDSTGNVGIKSVRVWAYDSSYQFMIARSFTDTDGNYTIPRMPTCNAKIYFDADYNRLNYVSEFYNNKSSFEEADSVSTVVGDETLGINAELGDRPSLSITTTSPLPDGNIATPYGTTLEATGGTESYYWSLVQSSNPLPNGLVLHSTGLIDGTPATQGTFNFTVQVVDYSSPPQIAIQSFDITINPYAGTDLLISGTVTADGSPVQGAVMAGLPEHTITNEHGKYTAAVPSGWTGTVTPTLIVYTFDPPNRFYDDPVTSNQENQDYAASYMGGEQDDAYEENDDMASAKSIVTGTHTNLVYLDEDWYKVYITPASAGKDLKIHMKGIAYPDPNVRRDLDFGIWDNSGKLLGYVLSSCDDETLYITNLAEGWYYIGINYFSMDGAIYSLTAAVSDNFGIGYISGRVTDEESGLGIEGVYVELYGDPFDWDINRPLITTDAGGNYKVGFTPGNYTVKFNLHNNYHRDDRFPDVNYVGETYNSNEIVTIVAGTTVPDIDAELAPGGTITGRVTGPDGDGLNMATVYVHASNASRVSFARTDDNGYYTAERMRTGNYKVRFRAIYPYRDIELGMKWYEDRGSFSDGLPVPVQAGSTTSEINAQLEESGYIEGRVTDSNGDPIQGVSVLAYDVAGISLFSGGTNENGDYRIWRRLPSGDVVIYFDASTTGGNYVSEYYTDKLLREEADPVTVQSGQTTYGINAQLADGGTITGRVTDSEGNGLYDILVTCPDIDSDNWYYTNTDGNGDYAIEHILPDDYKVRFRAGIGNWAVEWHNDKTSFAEGNVVSVGAGATVSGIDAQLSHNGGFISGTVTALSGPPIEGVRVFARDGSKNAIISLTDTDADGNYTISRIPTCEAKIHFNADVRNLNHTSEYYNNKSTFESADLVATTLGQTTSGIDAVLAPIPPLSISTTLLPNGEAAVPYSATLEVTGGREFYHWSVISSTLPDGLTLYGNGVISGTPTTQGTSNFTVQVTDSCRTQLISSQSLSITIDVYSGPGNLISGVVLFEGSPLPGVVMDGLPVNPTTSAQGKYIVPVTSGWSGVVKPTKAGYFFDPENRIYTNVTVPQENEDYTAYELTLIIITDWLLNGTEGYPYSQTLEAEGGSEPGTYSWSLVSGSLPYGLTLDSNGVISGTPTNPDTYYFTVRVTDSSSPGPQIVEKALSITIHPEEMISEEMITFWKFDEGSGTTAIEYSGQGVDGTLHGNATYTNDAVEGYAVETYGQGWIRAKTGGGGFYFADEATIMAHVKIANFDGQERFIWKLQYDHPVQSWPYTIEIHLNINGNYLNLSSGNGLKESIHDCQHFNINIDLSNPTNGFILGQYNHIALTIKDDSYKIFINGNEVASAQGAMFEVNDNIQNFWVMGADWSDYWLEGKIDELIVVNRIASPEEVNQHYNEGPWLIISGAVTVDGSPLPGVEMNGLIWDPTTNEQGEYTGIVPPGFSETVTPTLDGYAFNPTSRSYSNVTYSWENQDYAAFLGYTISGTVTFNGSPVKGMVLSSLPGDPITNEHGEYTAAVPSGWSGTVTPTLIGYTFDPPSRSYNNVNYNQVNQDYAASYVGGEQDDTYEENDDSASAKEITVGTYYANLVYLDEDWYKVYITPADVGKDLKVHMKGTIYPDPNEYMDLDFGIFNSSGKLLGYVLSGSDDETLYISDLAEGWYYIGINYFSQDGAVYSMKVEIGDSYSFGIAYISGTVTDGQGQGIENIYVELYGDPFDWEISRPLITTDSDGYYKIGYAPGNYKVLFNLTSLRYDWAPDPNYVGEYYDDKSSFDEADTVSIVFSTTNEGINAELVKGGTITGRVTDPSMAAITRASVRAYDLNGNHISFSWTDENGDYKLERLPIGIYKIKFYTSRDYAIEWYNDKPSFADADTLEIQKEGQTITGIDAQLAYEGYLEGKVTDSMGTGIGNVRIYVYDTSQFLITSSGTNTGGYYSVRRLPTGNFKVYFDASYTDYISEWYDDKNSFEDADLVPTEAGMTTFAINAFLKSALTITTVSLPNGVVNDGYSATLEATGGTPPYTWSLASGSLPDGLNPDISSGVISGTPTTPDTFNFSVQVIDQTNPQQSYTQELSIAILTTYTLDATSNPEGGGSVSKKPNKAYYIEGESVELTVTVNGGYTFIGWSGDASGTASPIYVQMTDNKNITANFAQIADLPDYYIASFGSPGSANAGEEIGSSLSATVGNQGANYAYPDPIFVGFYLSTDSEITTSDILLWEGRESIAALNSGQTVSVSIGSGMKIPTTVSTGEYYIGVLVDESDVIIESNENNNYASQQIDITPAGTGHLEIAGAWPYGALYSLDIDETRNLALIGNGAVLQILDVSNPSNPTLISELSLPPGDLFVIKIKGIYAYVANGGSLKVINISDRENPWEVGSCDTAQSIFGLDISGDYAYVTDYLEGLRIIDISNPENPFQTAFLPLPHITRAMKVSGNYAYVQARPRHNEGGEGLSGLRIIDISDAYAPVEKKFIRIENGVLWLDIDASGQFLFAPIWRDRLRIFDISNPEVLSEVASYDGLLNPCSVTISGNYAYVLDRDQDKLVVLDISDVYNLTEASSYSFEDQPDLWETRVAGNLCFVGCYSDSLKILDFSNLESPQELGSYDVQGQFYYGDVSNDHAYLVNYKGGQYGLKILDISNLSAISDEATHDLPYNIYGLAASGDHAYLATYDNGLRAIDITDPSSPQEVGFCEDAREAYDVAISGNYAYVADGWSGLRIIDISTPSSPSLVSTWDTPGWANQVALSGNYAYLADDWRGLRIIDISDPLNPWEVGSYEFEGWAWNVAVSGGYAYVSDSYKVLRIIDVSDPENPSEVSSLDVYLLWGDIGISGNFIIVPDYIFGVRVIDVLDPANPTEVEVLRELSVPEQIIIRENYIYIVSDDSGFYVLEFRLPSLWQIISGKVTTDGADLQGVLMAGLPGSPPTDEFGEYTATVSTGWTGTVTPTLAEYTFSPAGIPYENITNNQTNQDYEATPIPSNLDHFEFDVIGNQTAGTAFSLTITAKDSSGDTITAYTGANTLSDSTGTISPTFTGAFEGGTWTGDITISMANTGNRITTSGGGKSGVSNEFDVTVGAFDHFEFDYLDDQTAGTPFSITITAKDSSGNTVTIYTGSNTLSDLTGTISPTFTGEFTNGTWTGDITITMAKTGNRITTSGGGKTRISAAFNVTPGTATKILVETASDGSGIVVPAQNVSTAYTSITAYAIERDTFDNFVANVEADSWSLINESGGVILAPEEDMKSAVFTGHAIGSANIHVEKSGLTSIDSGTLTVILTDIVLNGSDYSDISDTIDRGWEIDGDVIYTWWSDEWVEYTASLTTGNWNIGLCAINHGGLGDDPNWYPQFELSNSLTDDIIIVPASDTDVNCGFFNFQVPSDGPYTVRLTWLNDKAEGEGSEEDPWLDANIKIIRVFFDKN